MGNPRKHHQYFTHKATPELAFQEKARFLEVAEKQGDLFMESFWVTVGQELSPEENLGPVDLHHKIRVKDSLKGVITVVPPAENPGEAFFTVFIAETHSGFFGRSLRNFRYFVLERTEDHRGSIRTMLVEIDSKLRRTEIGRGSLPDSDDFWRMAVRYVATGELMASATHLGIK